MRITYIHQYFDGSRSAEQNLGGTVDSDPDAVSWGLYRIDVFYKSGRQLNHVWYP